MADDRVVKSEVGMRKLEKSRNHENADIREQRSDDRGWNAEDEKLEGWEAEQQDERNIGHGHGCIGQWV